MPKFILLNGPPRSGKDTAAGIILNILARADLTAYEDKLSAPIKEAFAAVVGADVNGFNVVGYENRKEEVLDIFGVSFRQWQIDFSEKFMKPLYGRDIFGVLLLERAKLEAHTDYCVVSDCGFEVEAAALAKEDFIIIQFHRPGCTFEGDSREWVEVPGKTFYVKNDGSLAELETALYRTLYIARVIGG